MGADVTPCAESNGKLIIPNKSRVVQIGFNKTGTTSLGRFFKQNGYVVRSIGMVEKIKRNLQSGRHAFAGLPHFDLAQDLEDHGRGTYIYQHYEEIFHQYPGYYYILTTRSCEKWIASRLRHHGGRYVRRAMRHTGIFDLDKLCNYWREEFYDYHLRVTRFFCGRPNFYVHSLECINTESLARFLEKDFYFHNLEYPKIVTGGKQEADYSLDNPD